MHTLLKQTIDLALDHLGSVDGIYLYGSYGSEHVTDQSDVDLAILTTKKIPTKQLLDLNFELSRLFQRDVDLVDLRQSDTVFKQQILSTGKRIYAGNKTACELFALHTLSDYIDLNGRRANIIAEAQQRGSILG